MYIECTYLFLILIYVDHIVEYITYIYIEIHLLSVLISTSFFLVMHVFKQIH